MLTGWILSAIGLFILLGVVVFNIGMNSRRAQRMVGFIGIAGTKILYTVIGLGLLVYGVLILTGIVVPS